MDNSLLNYNFIEWNLIKTFFRVFLSFSKFFLKPLVTFTEPDPRLASVHGMYPVGSIP